MVENIGTGTKMPGLYASQQCELEQIHLRFLWCQRYALLNTDEGVLLIKPAS